MIIRFLKKLFCFHDYEQEESLTTNEYFEVCKKCDKIRVIKVRFGQGKLRRLKTMKRTVFIRLV